MMTKRRAMAAKLRKTYRVFQDANGWVEAARFGFDVSNSGVACSADPVTLGMLADWCGEQDDWRIQGAADYFRTAGDVCERLHRGYSLDSWFRTDVARMSGARFNLVASTLAATAPDGHGWVTDQKVLFRPGATGRRKLHRLAGRQHVKDGGDGGRGGRLLEARETESVLGTARNRLKYGVPVEGPTATGYDHETGLVNARFDWPNGAGRTWVNYRYLQLLRGEFPRATFVIHTTKEGRYWAVAAVDGTGEVLGVVMPLIWD
jgi:hypothetical protein